MPGRIAAAAENALLRELAYWYHQLNASLFDSALRPPTLSFEASARQLGKWDPRQRTLTLSRALIEEHPWGVVLEVLKHEMAHQYCTEVLGVSGESPHGDTFRRVCKARGVDGRAMGLPASQADPARDKVLRRIQRLLALADSPEEHEAQAAMNAAQRLMLKHNLSIAEAGVEQSYHVTWLGEPSKRLQAYQRILAGILSEHFFVQCVWIWSYDAARGARGRVLEVTGTASNLEMATWVHAFVLGTAERLWTDHKRRRGIPGNKDRRRFLSGVMVGFHEKLQGQERKHRSEGLVWVGDADLEAYVGARHPSVRKARAASIRVDDAFGSGRSAGHDIVLHKPVAHHGRARGLRLGGPTKGS